MRTSEWGVRVAGCVIREREGHHRKPTYWGSKMMLQVSAACPKILYQDPPCTSNGGYMVPNSRFLAPNIG